MARNSTPRVRASSFRCTVWSGNSPMAWRVTYSCHFNPTHSSISTPESGAGLARRGMYLAYRNQHGLLARGSGFPGQQGTFRVVFLHLAAGTHALQALGAGKLGPLVTAGRQAHGAGFITGLGA